MDYAEVNVFWILKSSQYIKNRYRRIL